MLGLSFENISFVTIKFNIFYNWSCNNLVKNVCYKRLSKKCMQVDFRYFEIFVKTMYDRIHCFYKNFCPFLNIKVQKCNQT